MTVAATDTLPPAPGSARRARVLVERTLRSWGYEELLEGAVAVVTELVANVVEHAGTDGHLAIRLDDSHVRLEVTDASRALATLREPSSDPLDDPGGLGLVLVRALSDRWGVDHSDGGKSVWAEWRLPR